MSAAWFDNSYRNIIATRTISFNPFISQYFNIGLTSARGAELDADVALVSGFRAKTGYTFTDSEILESTSTSAVFKAGQLGLPPSAPLRVPEPGLERRARVGRPGGNLLRPPRRQRLLVAQPRHRENDGYAQWDLRASARLTKTFSLTGAIDNLTDSDRMEPLGYPVLDGRSASASGLGSEELTARPRAAVSWSGGKDSLAAVAATRDQFDLVCALTMFDESGQRSRSHGLRPELVAAQAARLGLRSVTARCAWSTYDAAFTAALRELAADGITHVVFGDLVYPEHREWAEARCAEAGLTAVEPLFGMDTGALFDAFVASGATALMVTVREPWLDESWLGRPLSAGMKDDFAPAASIPAASAGSTIPRSWTRPSSPDPIAVTLRRSGAPRRMRRPRPDSRCCRRLTSGSATTTRSPSLRGVSLAVPADGHRRDPRTERLRQDDAAADAGGHAPAAARVGHARRRAAHPPLARRAGAADGRRAAGDAARLRLHRRRSGDDGPLPASRPFEIEGPADLAVIEETLTSTGTLHLKDRLFATLSGGEKQRVVIAAALAQIFRLSAKAERRAQLRAISCSTNPPRRWISATSSKSRRS